MPPSRTSHPEHIREEAANVLLAQLLRDHGLSARAERRSRQGAPDIRVDLRGGDLAILECKWDGARRLLEDQLHARLGDFPEALGVFGVLYPNRLRQVENTQAGLQASELQWWLHGSRGAPRSQPTLRRGSVRDLADELRAFPLDLEGVDRVAAAAQVVGHALEQAAGRIVRHRRIARRIADIIAQTDQEKDRAAALRIGCLVLFNALAFQDRLAAANDDVPTVREALHRGIPGLRDAWHFVWDRIDYRPVLELALEILDVLTDGPDETQLPVIQPLLGAVQRTRDLEGHDLSGRLFHTLLTDAKFTGAYYTSVPAATLLTRLVFHDWPEVDWRDHEFPASLNVADLACGTGTLLMAVAAEAERRHRQAGGTRAADLHKAMVEEALHGYDVQLSAVHFAATSLAMLNPDIQFDRMNLYVMSLGVEGSELSLGSLDFLNSDAVAVQHALSPADLGVATLDRARVSGRGPRGAEEGETATLPDLDLAIMNPPFTRSVGGNLLFGSLPARDRRRLQTELSRRLKSRQASATAGLGAAFVAAASPRLRPGEGRLALVLPATVCTGPSWRQTRDLIQRDFVLDTVVTSHDPQRWNFSDSTDLSESLLIATRRPIRHSREDGNLASPPLDSSPPPAAGSASQTRPTPVGASLVGAHPPSGVLSPLPVGEGQGEGLQGNQPPPHSVRGEPGRSLSEARVEPQPPATHPEPPSSPSGVGAASQTRPTPVGVVREPPASTPPASPDHPTDPSSAVGASLVGAHPPSGVLSPLPVGEGQGEGLQGNQPPPHSVRGEPARSLSEARVEPQPPATHPEPPSSPSGVGAASQTRPTPVGAVREPPASAPPASPPPLTPHSSPLSPSSPRTTFINLWRNPTGVLDAHRLARAVAATTPARLEDAGTALLEIDGQHVGEVVSLPESKLRGPQWTGVQFARADLLRSSLRLLNDGQVWVPGQPRAAPVPLCRIDQLGQVGPDRRDVWDGFELTAAATAYPIVMNHDTEQRTRLTAPPDKYLAPLVEPRPGRRLKPLDQLWSKAGRLLVTERLRLNTVRVVAMRSETNVLSNVWWPVRIDDESIEKALAVWLNSSLGLLTIVAQRTSTEGGWVALKKADLQQLPVLDPRRLSPSQRQDLTHLFDQLTATQFQRLPALPHDPTRQTLDDALSKILNLPTLTTLRHLLSTEPTISNHRL